MKLQRILMLFVGIGLRLAGTPAEAQNPTINIMSIGDSVTAGEGRVVAGRNPKRVARDRKPKEKITPVAFRTFPHYQTKDFF